MIHAPHALPLFREPRPGGKRKREKERADPVKSQMPDRGGAAPLKPGTGGQIGATGGTLLTQYVLKNQARAPGSCLACICRVQCRVQAHMRVVVILPARCLCSTCSRSRRAPNCLCSTYLLQVPPLPDVVPAHVGTACRRQVVPALAHCLTWQASVQSGSCNASETKHQQVECLHSPYTGLK